MSASDDAEPTAKEHDAFYKGVAERLEEWLSVQGGDAFTGAAYIRGDFFGHRSETMHVAGSRFAGRVDVLAGAVRLVQAYVAEHPKWRVCLWIGEDAIAIYPRRLLLGSQELDECRLTKTLQSFVDRDVAAQEAEQAARKALLADIAPLLPEAVSRARSEGFPQLLAQVDSENSFGIWVVHPEQSIFDVEGTYQWRPTCYREGVFELDARGMLLPETTPLEDVAAVLVLWTPAEPGARQIALHKGKRSAVWKRR